MDQESPQGHVVSLYPLLARYLRAVTLYGDGRYGDSKFGSWVQIEQRGGYSWERRVILKLASLLLALTCLISRAGRYNHRMTLMMEPFMGKPITQVAKVWGPP